MKRELAPGKSLSQFLWICVGLSIVACTAPENPEIRSEPAVEAAAVVDMPSAKTSALLITLQTTQRFQHLRRHQGQVLLTREQLQLVISGIPLLKTNPPFSPLLAKVYKQSGKSWHAQAWLPTPELALRTEAGERLQLIGQDLEAYQGSHRVVSLYRSLKQPEAEARVYLSIVPQGPALEVEIQSTQGLPLLWDIRFSQGLGEEHTIPYQQEMLAGLTKALLPDASSIVSSVPMKPFKQGLHHHISSARAQTQGGFYVLLDKAALQQQPKLVAQAIGCFQNAAADSSSLSCLRGGWSPGVNWTIQLPAKGISRGEKRMLQALYFHNKAGAFRGVLAIFEGEQLKIAQAPTEELELLTPDTEGVLQHRKLDASSSNIQLPALQRGSLSLNVEPSEPSFVEIRDAVHADGISIQAWLSVRSADLLSPHTILQKSWPLQTKIPAGDYRIQVFTGKKIICQQRLTIRANKSNQVSCQAEGPQPKLSPRASLSLDSSQHGRELLQAASMQVSSRSERQASTSSADLLAEIPIIEATDPDLGLSLRAFPATEAIRSAWQAYKAQHDGQRLQDFMSFVRTQAKQLQVQLECPAVGFQLEEYEWLALSFRPDLLEVFGCLQPEMTPALLAIAHRLQQKSSKAVKLSVASPYRSLFQLHAVIPAMYLWSFPASADQGQQGKAEAEVKAEEAEALLEALRLGHYSLGLRSEIELDQQNVNFSSRSLAMKIRTYDRGKLPLLLRIHDQNGLLSEFPLPSSPLSEQDLKVPLRLEAQSRWLRIELLGRRTDSVEEDPAFLLATTNFLRLDGAP